MRGCQGEMQRDLFSLKLIITSQFHENDSVHAKMLSTLSFIYNDQLFPTVSRILRIPSRNCLSRAFPGSQLTSPKQQMIINK